MKQLQNTGSLTQDHDINNLYKSSIQDKASWLLYLLLLLN